MLIADRNGMVSAKKSAPTAHDYVQTGLIAMWDGIENAGWGVHDPNATTWKDLTGNANDLTLWPGGDETWEANALANADTGSPRTSCMATMLHDPGQFATIEVVFRNDQINLTRDLIRPFETPSAQWHGCLVYTTKISFGYGTYGALVYTPVAGAVVSASATFSSSTSQTIDIARIDGIDVALTSNWSSTVYDRFVLGGRVASGAPFVGAVYSVRLYSSALTAAEVAANYAVDSIRFNLTGGGGVNA